MRGWRETEHPAGGHREAPANGWLLGPRTYERVSELCALIPAWLVRATSRVHLGALSRALRAHLRQEVRGAAVMLPLRTGARSQRVWSRRQCWTGVGDRTRGRNAHRLVATTLLAYGDL